MTQDLESLMRRYAEEFGASDEEEAYLSIPNREAADWLAEHAPRISLPDKEIERCFYFRLWTYRKHIRKIPGGHVVTEFLPPVGWAGAYNSISCPLGHHFAEGRWFHGTDFLRDDLHFWTLPLQPHLGKYSHYLESGVLDWLELSGEELSREELAALMEQDRRLEELHLDPTGLYWSSDRRDGSEYSVSGPGLRPSMNSYRFAAARALALLCQRAGLAEEAEAYREKAARIRKAADRLLWNEEKGFYLSLPKEGPGAPVDPDPERQARELFGYLPWAFGLAGEGKGGAFRLLLDKEKGFGGAFGLTSVERSSVGFGLFTEDAPFKAWLDRRGEPLPKSGHLHECLWNGPSWPFVSCLALRALAAYLTGPEPDKVLTPEDHAELLHTYAASQTRLLPDGRRISWIDEDLDPDTGEWIARSIQERRGWPEKTGGRERGKDYNHSTFADLVLRDLFGIRPSGDCLRIEPLLPASWKQAELENVYVHGKELRIRWDSRDAYRVSLGGKEVFAAKKPCSCCLELQ